MEAVAGTGLVSQVIASLCPKVLQPLLVGPGPRQVINIYSQVKHSK